MKRTLYPPAKKPVMVWDGKCGFCQYWITVWKKHTGGAIEYVTFQRQAGRFPDIPESYFEGAVRLIEPDGRVYNGPDAAYRSMRYYKRRPVSFFHRWYTRSGFFRAISDYGYHFVTTHRPFMLKLSKLIFGSRP
ncbi:DCC1-like thiol-disulfide oxidoreductase family protein [Fulvivirga ulvae]|uniref:thiol-disulfide oxidoreductase DCC family protein n=1 Tax=Fulvivirga ulvae TaxID=2904245 RepID=UPI001F367AE6|nr:DCC1-like thiol-disulfide oxidoreductase family protein [Fulvivirga ulvae]UII31393.1 DCC1-like thiol-disulfide oxidoreductase family protein [Fulvivirga ulvae]